MSRASPQLLSFAKRLLVHEAHGHKASALTLAAFQVNEKLRPHLVTLMGKAAFRALLSRAVALANEDISWLRAVHVKADGTLEGLEELHGQVATADFVEGRLEVLAQLLGLLVAFIGMNMTLHLMSEVWPDVSLKSLELSARDKK